jgi:hypothetical protein
MHGGDTRPTAWLEIDGVINVNRPFDSSCAYAELGTDPVWVRPTTGQLLRRLSQSFDIRIVTYWDSADARRILQLAGIDDEADDAVITSVKTVDNMKGWDSLVSSGVSPLVAGKFPAGKVLEFMHSRGLSVWIDPEAASTVSQVLTDSTSMHTFTTDVSEGLTREIVDSCLQLAHDAHR